MRSCRSNNPVAASSNLSAQSCSPVVSVDKMRGNPETAAGATDAALERIANAEVAHRPPRVDRRILDADHGKRLEARQLRDDVIDQPLDEARLVGTAAEIGEWHDRDERTPRRRTDRWPLGLGQDQPIADPRHRHDPVMSILAWPERLAKRRDLDGEVALLDDCAGPGAIEEVILRDDHPPGFQKGIEQ